MIQEWARAMYNEVASSSDPPNSEVFDPSKQRTSLIVGSHPSIQTASVLNQELHIFAGMVSDVCALAHPKIPPAPVAPKQGLNSTSNPTTTPLGHLVTLNSLNWFLHYTESEMGIGEAMSYESPLRRQAYEPDILHKVSDSALKALSIPSGHVICMKEASRLWFTGPLFLKDRDSPSTPINNLPAPAPHQVDYK
ncbi:hypothetical protein FIBSPDRAFT_955304 [Athelia psychrophila]|uniref:Uncharacterized protein n=1 Tax=Athelia psychrophila TaxID=1759441 RepID=A0A166IBP0_9AGAM|nr:hypothetical protein FIBSPDRAFT_955304 [Fibularhizoctonia sp. CBS 109695]